MSPNKDAAVAFLRSIEGAMTSIDVAKTASFLGSAISSTHVGTPAWTGSGTEWTERFIGLVNTYFPGTDVKFKIIKVLEENDQVWVWCEIAGFGPTKQSVDIFTFQEGKIVEHFDVQQDLPQQ